MSTGQDEAVAKDKQRILVDKGSASFRIIQLSQGTRSTGAPLRRVLCLMGSRRG